MLTSLSGVDHRHGSAVPWSMRLVDQEAAASIWVAIVGKVSHDHLVVSDGFAERFSLMGVLQRGFVGALSDPRAWRDADAASSR